MQSINLTLGDPTADLLSGLMGVLRAFVRNAIYTTRNGSMTTVREIHATAPDLFYRSKRQAGDVAIWDKRA